MRRRDLHFLIVEVVLTGVSLATCALCFYSSFRWARRVHARLEAVEERAAIAERTCADASGAALAACEAVRNGFDASSISDDSPAVPTRILGYGQSRTAKGTRYIYRDTLLSDGSVDRQREFLPTFGPK